MNANSKYGLHSVNGDADAAFAALAKAELVVTDCDGTLLYTDKALGQPAIDAVRRLKEAGVRFTVASSRPGKGMRHIVEALDVDMPYASYNGGSLVRPGTWDLLSSHKLPRDVVQTSLEALASANVDAWVFIDDAWYLTNQEGTYVPLETRTVGYEGVLVTRFDDVDLGEVDKIVGSTADTALLARVESSVQKQLMPRTRRALADLLPRYHEPGSEQGHCGTRTGATRERAARTRGRARRHGQRCGDVRDRGRIDRDGAGIRQRAASREPGLEEQRRGRLRGRHRRALGGARLKEEGTSTRCAALTDERPRRSSE